MEQIVSGIYFVFFSILELSFAQIRVIAFINEDQNKWNPKSAMDISRVFAFSFGTFIKGLENTFVRPQWNEFVMENGIHDPRVDKKHLSQIPVFGYC